MRNQFLSIVGLALVLTVVPVASIHGAGQQQPKRPEVTPGPGWKTCARCQSKENVEYWRQTLKVEGHAFNPRDISGVWYNDNAGVGGINLETKTAPALTPYGQQLWQATQSTTDKTNDKDGMLICDPLGYPRSFTYNYGNEFIQLPDRTLQFFEWEHTWRTIWTDGRQLPTDPPQARWMGYTVGRWEGDVFIVESNGFDDRSWLDQDRRPGPFRMKRGMPHSDEMRVVERYRRTSYETLEVELTVIDPKVYAAPWTTKGVSYLRPGAEINEDFCVPSESDEYNKLTHGR